MISLNLLRVVVISGLVCSSAVHAEPIKLIVKDVEGLWFPLPSAKRLLNTDIELTKVKSQLDLFLRKDALHDANITLLKSSVTIEKSITEIALRKLKTAEDAVSSSEAKLSAWYRQPWFWFTVGVLTSATVISTVSGIVLSK